MSGEMVIVCAANKGGRQHNRILGETVGSHLTFRRPSCWALATEADPPANEQLHIATVIVECPEHGQATVPPAELVEAAHRAQRSHRRVELRVYPTKHRAPAPGAEVNRGGAGRGR